MFSLINWLHKQIVQKRVKALRDDVKSNERGMLRCDFLDMLRKGSNSTNKSCYENFFYVNIEKLKEKIPLRAARLL